MSTSDLLDVWFSYVERNTNRGDVWEHRDKVLYIPLDRLGHHKVVQFVDRTDLWVKNVRMSFAPGYRIDGHVIECTALSGVNQVLVLRVGGVSDSLPIARGVAPQDISQSKGMINCPNTIVNTSIR